MGGDKVGQEGGGGSQDEPVAGNLQQKYQRSTFLAVSLLAFSPKILARKCYHVTILGGQGDIRVIAAGKQSLVRGTHVAFKFAPLKEKLLGLDHPFLKCFTPLSSSSSG